MRRNILVDSDEGTTSNSEKDSTPSSPKKTKIENATSDENENAATDENETTSSQIGRLQNTLQKTKSRYNKMKMEVRELRRLNRMLKV